MKIALQKLSYLCATTVVLTLIAMALLFFSAPARAVRNGDLTNAQPPAKPPTHNMAPTLDCFQPLPLPYVDVIPSLDGAELLVRLVGEGAIGDTTFAEVIVGPTGHMLSWTDTVTDNLVTAVVPGVPPQTNLTGVVEITTTLYPEVQTVQFYRAYVPTPNQQTLRSVDDAVEVQLVSTDTLTSDSYLVLMPTFGLPGALPADYCLVRGAYTLRAAGGQAVANRPMNLRFYADAFVFAEVPRQLLTVLQWDEALQLWAAFPGNHLQGQNYLSLATADFTTYGLAVAPRWFDDFADATGLRFPAETSNITLGGTPANRTLQLAALATTGYATSQLITPTLPAANWSTFTYSATGASATTMRIDLLAADGAVVRRNLQNGEALAELDHAALPALKLRAYFTATVEGASPRLDWWSLAWERRAYPLYLPMILGEHK
jgi:hypothetical protein